LDKIVKKGELVVGMSGDYPPFNVKAKSGKLIGFDVDLAGALAEGMGVKVKVVQIPFSDLLSNLEAGKIDMVVSAMTMTPKRNLKFAFVGPYFLSGQALLTTRETAIKAVTMKDVNKADFALAVPAGTTSEMVAKKYLTSTKLTVSKDMDAALKLLLAGKIKAVLTDNATASVASFRYGDKGIISTGALTFEPIGIAVTGEDPLLLNWLENLLGMLKGGGEMDALTDKWFKDPSWVKELP
jgi:polar amino acid transport system substrate-binding protein